MQQRCGLQGDVLLLIASNMHGNSSTAGNTHDSSTMPAVLTGLEHLLLKHGASTCQAKW